MFSLGFWKKLVYTMNISTSIDLCYRFNDLYNFNELLERLDDSESSSDLHKCQQVLIVLKWVNIAISKQMF